MGPGRGRNQLLERSRLLVTELNQSKKNRRHSKEVNMRKGIRMIKNGSISFCWFCLNCALCRRIKPGMQQSSERKSPDLRSSTLPSRNFTSSHQRSCRILSAWIVCYTVSLRHVTCISAPKFEVYCIFGGQRHR